MNNFIPLSVPNLKGNELKYVTDAIENEWVSTGGAYIDRFEKEISKYLNVSEAVSCQSGTAGIHLALRLLDINENHEVIVPTLTFIAAVNPIKYVGSNPVFMDCDDSLNMNLHKLEEFLEKECEFKSNKVINKTSGKEIKAIIIVHIFGNMTNMEKLMNIADKYNLKVIEDATEALGSYYIKGKYKDKFAGTIGDFGVFSFNGNKIITTGGGGMLVSKHSELLKKAKYLSTQAKNNEIYYIHNDIGYNYRMTNVQAAIGVAQLEQLEKFISAKKRNYEIYKQKLNNKNISLLDFNENIRPNYWFYSLIIDNFDKNKVLKDLNDNRIQTRPIWGLINEQKPYLNNQSYNIEKAKYYYDRILNIPCSSNLSELNIEAVIKKLNSIGVCDA